MLPVFIVGSIEPESTTNTLKLPKPGIKVKINNTATLIRPVKHRAYINLIKIDNFLGTVAGLG
ncbi:MAG: hypothetical protein A2445_02095 [Candidatus Jacksonbacteria bacterium RIFOXYC2_FULL_44_29]|nr:MAG: hypothetical protein A2295_05485 [Candidatus Jacksonbacteria bacterium RIFOXYB2_FULL_44_15]OGY78376.1 MAG: hypothetical protein A2550_06455 [Candidatus Jacksonbacteria bacterium RIFOXYD2_FULL_43_21]OGY81082.1 MAG: hypothetical protein A2445_02095 [Candidatus Jacksonbacteria bacterium RIFOXYC2_FULL_44_29]